MARQFDVKEWRRRAWLAEKRRVSLQGFRRTQLGSLSLCDDHSRRSETEIQISESETSENL